MTKLQVVLKEISELNSNELEVVLKEILQKMNKAKAVNSILEEYKGIGKGIWNTDAQDHVNKLRDGDRL